jgi:hypothetical protein
MIRVSGCNFRGTRLVQRAVFCRPETHVDVDSLHGQTEAQKGFQKSEGVSEIRRGFRNQKGFQKSEEVSEIRRGFRNQKGFQKSEGALVALSRVPPSPFLTVA